MTQTDANSVEETLSYMFSLLGMNQEQLKDETSSCAYACKIIITGIVPPDSELVFVGDKEESDTVCHAVVVDKGKVVVDANMARGTLDQSSYSNKFFRKNAPLPIKYRMPVKDFILQGSTVLSTR